MPKSDADDNFWTALHTAQGFFAGLFAVSFLMATPQASWVTYFGERLWNWQTLMAGLLALYAAGKTVQAIRSQVDQADRHEEDRRRRKHYAARADMPVTLVALSDYTRSCLVELKKVPFTPGQRLLLPSVPTLVVPDVPAEAVKVLRECIETADEGPRDAIATMLEHLQIQHSRLAGTATDIVPPSSMIVMPQRLSSNVADTVAILARVNLMFDYARRQREDIPKILDLDTLKNLADTAGFDEYEYVDIEGRLQHKVRESTGEVSFGPQFPLPSNTPAT